MNAAGREGAVIVREFRRTASDEDMRLTLLALASAIAQAKGWKLQAAREGDGVVFEVRVPEAGAQGPERKSEPARTHGAADAPDQS